MMKKCLSLLLALCLGLLAGCGSAPSVDYPELPAVDTDALELESASNSSLKVSFLKADWVAEPNTDPLSVYYRETADSDYTVNVNAQVSQAYDGTLSESDKDDLVDSMGVLKCGLNEFEKLDPSQIVRYRKNQFGYEVLIGDKTGFVSKNRDCIVDPVSIEEIMLFYVRGRMK